MNYLELAKKNGGFTLDFGGQPVKFTNGYLVSFPNVETRIELDRLSEESLTRLIRVYCQLAVESEGENILVGSWIKDGLVLYLDLSEHVENPFEAWQLGAERNQLAIFDCAAGKSIYL